MENIKLIIAGSRDFDDYSLLEKEVDTYILDTLFNLDKNLYDCYLLRTLTEEVYGDIPIEIVSGGARGADRLGELYARNRKLVIKQFIPNWSIGKSAGYIRNEEMAKYATHCICFWNGSKGTKHMIDIATRYNLGLKVVNL